MWLQDNGYRNIAHGMHAKLHLVLLRIRRLESAPLMGRLSRPKPAGWKQVCLRFGRQ